MIRNATKGPGGTAFNPAIEPSARAARRRQRNQSIGVVVYTGLVIAVCTAILTIIVLA